MTLKKAILRGLFGIPIGVFISYTITIFIAVIEGGYGANKYSAVTPGLVSQMGGELNAVVVQYILSCVLGFACATASAIYEIENWSITRQTVVHFLLVSVSSLPIALCCRWISYTVPSVLSYFTEFALIYFIIWLAQRWYWRRRIEQINAKIQSK
jgi:Protein of unknown function (DUF3021).